METNLNSYFKPHLVSTASMRGGTVLDLRVRHTGSNRCIALFSIFPIFSCQLNLVYLLKKF